MAEKALFVLKKNTKCSMWQHFSLMATEDGEEEQDQPICRFSGKGVFANLITIGTISCSTIREAAVQLNCTDSNLLSYTLILDILVAAVGLSMRTSDYTVTS